VVAVDSPGLRESVVHEKTGFLVPEEDDSGLAERAVQILEDPELRGRLSREAARWVARFDWEETAGRTLGLIERVRAEHGG
jgi:glycosyltransferase involved in cell wall biosynthesis